MSAANATVRRRGSIYDARIAGLYDLEETIGRGHFAVVKVAKHVFTGVRVAVKVIDKTKLDPVSKEHLFQEVRCMKLVQHPNIVRLYEVIDTQTKLFLILELGDCDMFEFITRQGENGLPEEEAQKYLSQIVRAISYCHKLHVVHRDLKPENVVFVEKSVKLTDFGFSNLFTPGQQLDTSCGSLAYSAPEILLGDSYDAPAVDIWSLGVILYMMVCGRLPFQEANDSETLTKIFDCTFTLPPHLSEGCQHLIRRMLVREPAKRASLQEISESPWVKAGDFGHEALLPLVSREHVSDETHTQIVEQMVDGNIAEADEICRAVERDEYNYITATYYLLIERHMRKERQEQAQQLISALTKSDSHLQLASLALSPRLREKRVGGSIVVCTCADPSDCCPCVRANADGGETHAMEGLISPTTKSAADVSLDVPTAGGGGDRRWRHRACSIVREESEDDISVHLRSSRSASPVHGSPMISPSPHGRKHSAVSAELHELAGRFSGASSNGRNSAEGSRSPSPVEGAIRFKSVSAVSSGRKLPSISSSPHLVGICEEAEDAAAGSSSAADDFRQLFGGSPQTYSSIRMIRPRQAVVSPDVIRRYDKRVSGGRSRRSTSCSSSEASDDEERRLSFIHTHHCARRRRDSDDNDPPPSAGGGGGGGCSAGAGDSRRSSANGSSSHRKSSADDGKRARSSGGERNETARFLDARKLASKLRKLALAPIRETPNLVWPNLRPTPTPKLTDETRRWFKPLSKPKSCEHLAARTTANEIFRDSERDEAGKTNSPPMVEINNNDVFSSIKTKFRHHRRKKKLAPNSNSNFYSIEIEEELRYPTKKRR